MPSSQNRITVIDAALTRELLPMSECIEAMDAAMRNSSGRRISIPPRALFDLHDREGFFASMPGSASDVLGAKLISFLPGNPARGRSAVAGFVALFDPETGLPGALVDGGEITRLRTGAASGLAARLLAREDARSCGIFGTGEQAAAHIEAMNAVRPLDEILVWGRDPAKAVALAARYDGTSGASVRATEEPEAAAACDLVCTTTHASEPVVKGCWVQPGCHLSLVGAHALHAREADSDLIARARVYVDSMTSARNESGDIMTPVNEGRISIDHVVGEIGAVLDGRIPGRETGSDITVYKSLGIVAQDLYAARLVLEKARASGAGTRVDF